MPEYEPEYKMDVQLAIRELENGFYIGEAINFPYVNRFHDSLEQISDGIKQCVIQVFKKMPIIDLNRHSWNGEAVVSEREIKIDPPRYSMAWRYPAPLTFHIVSWCHGSGLYRAFIPVLGIEVTGRFPEELEKRIPQQISSCLHRMGRELNLEEITRIRRCRQVILKTVSAVAGIKDLKKRVIEMEQPETEESVLKKAAVELVGTQLPPAFDMEAVTLNFAEIITDTMPTSILVTGPSGIGKTAAIYELVRKRKELGLSDIRFYESSGARIVAGQTGFGMWQERCRQLCRECRKEKIVLYLGNLMELMDVGKSEGNSRGVAAFLLPYISRGDIQIIAECTPDQMPLIERAEPRLMDLFRKVAIDAVTIKQCRAILVKCAENLTKRTGVHHEIEAIDEIIRLHKRFATYSVLPGRPVRFLDNLAHDTRKKNVTRSDVTARFAEETGLPGFMLDDDIPLDPDKVEKWFNEKVIGQKGAAEQVAAQLSLTKAGLARPGKPLSSMLFIGPTGVGKTETAKVLADFLFGDEKRLIRFDMSEYTDTFAVQRLIGGHGRQEGLMTAKIREQPFSVLLLDELEKAHPLFFDLLLQVIGEGRLTDRLGRMADFSNTVVIMTSNLGAQFFCSRRPGFSDNDKEGLLRIAEEVRIFFRPELVNRMDRIVPFYPLNKDALFSIAGKQIDRLKKRDGIFFQDIDLKVDKKALEYLAQKDYDPGYGARPLRRRIEGEILAPLSDKINRRKPGHRAVVNVHRKIDVHGQKSLELDVVAIPDRKQFSPFQITGSHQVRQIITKICVLRRSAQKILKAGAIRNFRNDLFRFRKLAEQAKIRLARRKHVKERQQRALEKLPAMDKVFDEINAAWQMIEKTEDEIMLSLYSKDLSNADDKTRQSLSGTIRKLEKKWKDALISWYCLKFENADKMTLGVYGKKLAGVTRLVKEYKQAFSFFGHKANLFWIERIETRPFFTRHFVKIPHNFLDQQSYPDTMLGMIFEIDSRASYAFYEEEQGLHRIIIENDNPLNCLVHCSKLLEDKYKPPKEIINKRYTGKDDKPRRMYKLESGFLLDAVLGTKIDFQGKSFALALKNSIDECLNKKIMKLVLQ